MMQLHYFYEFNKKTVRAVGAVISAILLIAAVFPYVNSRTYTYPRELVAIDSLCDTDAQSAKDELNKILYKYNTCDGEIHWYCRFLSLKARVKANENGIAHSEIDTLIRHYEGSANKETLAQVYYCAGCIYRNLTDITASNGFFLKSLETTEKTKNEKLKSLIYYQLGHNFSTQGLYKEALKYQLESFRYDKQHGSGIRTFYDCQDLAWTYGCLNNPGKTLEYLNVAKKIAYKANWKEQMSEIECQLAIFEMESNRLEAAKGHIDKAMKWSQGGSKSELYSTALEIYSKCNLTDKAKTYCDSVIKDGNIYGKKYAYWWLSVYHCKAGDLQSSLQSIEKYGEYSDSVSVAVSAEASAKANALYNYGIKEKENIILKNENAVKTLYITLILSISIICILTFCIAYIKIKKKRDIMEKRCNMLTSLREKENETNGDIIKQKEKEIEDIRKQLSSIKGNDMQEKIDLQNALNMKENKLTDINNDAAIKRISESNLKKSEIYKRIFELSSNGGTMKVEDWDNLRQTVFCIYPTFEEKISELDTMNETELKVCMLIRIGLNACKTANLVCISPNTVYSINRRLYHKNFGKYAAPSEWEKFIRSIY